MAKNSNITDKTRDIISDFSDWYYGLKPEMQQRVRDRIEGMLFTLDLKVQKENSNGKSSTNE